ncbi:hypothetical protein [Actinoplanes sp. NBRC 103695]|uniref:hypothetical protein n=1 Tax=Actinoplanes sp. NBRC 103695 TaxID=3032202 RepID=UPI002552B941|nr:hypothetical protein [Actinoplanes sp. NBRC 103695]
MRLLISLAATAAMVVGTAVLGSGTAAAAGDTRPIVDSTAYREPALEPDLNYNVGVPGAFTLRARIPDAASFVWRTDDGQTGTADADAGGDATVTIAPRRGGTQFLTVRTVGRDGTEYDEYAYEFLVDDGPLVVRDPEGIVYLGATPTFHLTPRTPDVQEYLVTPSIGGERPERTVIVPARADGTADIPWYLDDTGLSALLVRSRDAAGELSETRTAWANPDPALPRLTRTDGQDLVTPVTFTATTGMPGVVAYDVTFSDDPATPRSVAPAADGTATFSFTPTRIGNNWVKVTARNARGLTTGETTEIWTVVDRPGIASTDFPLFSSESGRKVPGTFTFTARRPGTTAFEWRTGTDWATLPAGADGTATLNWTPDRTGSFTISVRGVSADGTRSSLGTATFSVATVNGRLTSVTPATVTTGEKRTLTIYGWYLHPRDVIEVTPAGRAPIPATITSVHSTGDHAVVEVDFAGVPAGRASVTLKPYGGTVWDTLTDAITVAPLPALTVTKAPTVSGSSVRVGYTVSATAGTWSPAATSVKYQWRANGAAVSGATGSTLKIPASLAGKRLSVTVTASRTGNTATSATSASTVAVAFGSPLRATKAPKITGTAKVGRTLTVSAGTWTPSAMVHRYEWRLNGKIIKGATGRSLKLGSSLNGKRVSVTVIARSNGYLDGRATSGSVTVRR